jgi:RimJ/RimL family protein N-acetyltransferase
MFDYLQEEFDYQRIQASIAVTDKTAKRFAEWLGFQNEGVMKKYGPDGTDYYRYARVI